MDETTFDIVYAINREEEVYMTILDGRQLVEYWDDGIITYNPEIQRGVKITIKDNQEVEEPVFSKANVKKIYKSMVEGNFFEDMITLNVLKNEESNVSDMFFDESSDTNAITVCGDVNIADGQHRIRALKMLQESNERGITDIPLDSFAFPVKITHYDIKKAQQQFHQFSQGLKISTSRSEYFNDANYANKIVRELMRNSELAGRVEIVKSSIVKTEKKHVVTFATLVTAITTIRIVPLILDKNSLMLNIS